MAKAPKVTPWPMAAERAVKHLEDVNAELLAALERYLDDDCPYQCDADSCECGPNGNGRDEKNGVEYVCCHIQARRAVSKAKSE